MEFIQLKIPPDRVKLLIDSLNRDIMDTAPDSEITEITQIKVWLTYRLDKYRAKHPDTPAA